MHQRVLQAESDLRADLEELANDLPDDHRVFLGLVAEGKTWFQAARDTWPEETDIECGCRADTVLNYERSRRYLRALRVRTVLTVGATVRRAFMRLEMVATNESEKAKDRIAADKAILTFATRCYEQIAKVYDMDDPRPTSKVGITSDELERMHGYLTGQVVDTEATG